MTGQTTIKKAPTETKFLIIRGDGGRNLLTIDITEAGVEVDYDSSDLPKILEVIENSYRQNGLRP